MPGSTWDSKLRFMVDPQQTLRDLIAVVPLMNVVFCSHRLWGGNLQISALQGALLGLVAFGRSKAVMYPELPRL